MCLFYRKIYICRTIASNLIFLAKISFDIFGRGVSKIIADTSFQFLLE